MNVKISVLVLCVEALTYLLLHNLHDCTFKESSFLNLKKKKKKCKKCFFFKNIKETSKFKALFCR